MKKIGLFFLITCSLFTCNSNDDSASAPPKSYTILSLGDSYTIGESVCDSCGFPEQLKDSLINNFPNQDSFNLQVIAQTGWTTSDLNSALELRNINSDYDLITLLIGVNNQFQGLPLSTFQTEFDDIVNKSITLANGNKNRLVILNIPDYSNTEFGQIFGSSSIIEEIALYNGYIETYCADNNLNFIDVQNLIINGLVHPELIASDGLHPSELAYSNLVDQL
ncbi:SGNH/GDSL hydrolase family protein, partial [Winogradskyella sp.]|uniref:SGNH/GDSL hydrolase family protein n=1 Tax=Winogradskyella sp. TaxID=1883156 RepID=UPI003F6AC0C6